MGFITECNNCLMLKKFLSFEGCRFINVQVSALTDKWYGESQKLAGALFSLVSMQELKLKQLSNASSAETNSFLSSDNDVPKCPW